jgi:hypothetical protein
MQNPMMHTKGNLEAQRAAEEKAKALSEQLELQNKVNQKMAEAVRAAKKQSIGPGTRRRGASKKKKKKGRGQLEFGARKVGSMSSQGPESELKGLVSSNGDSLTTTGGASARASTGADATGAAGTTKAAPSPKPQRLPQGWRQSIDVVSGKPYFYKRETGQTSWDLPTESSTVL